MFPIATLAGYWRETSAVTTHNVVVTQPSGIVAGDRLLLFIAFGGSPSADPTVSGWTKIIGTALTNAVYVYEKFAAGNETDFTYTTAASVMSANRLMRITSSHASTPSEGSQTSDTTSHPNTPNLDPTGWGAEDTLWFSWVNWADATDTLSAYPTDYTGNQFTSHPWVTDMGLALCSRALNASAENPAAYVLTGPAGSWFGVTIAVRGLPGTIATRDVATEASLSAPTTKSVATAASLANTTKNVVTAASLSAVASRDVSTVASLGVTRLPPKTTHFHVYTSAGAVIRSWADVTRLPSFTRTINDGPGALVVTLARTVGSSGVPGEVGSIGDVKNGNLVDVYVVDRESGDQGVLIYSGKIKQHRVSYPTGNLVVTVVAKNVNFRRRWISENDSFTLTDDPSNMAKYLVDNDWLPGVTWVVANPLVGEAFTQTFSKMSVGQALDIIRRLAGGHWYYELRPDDTLRFNKWSEYVATHSVSQQHFSDIEYTYSTLDTYQRAIVYGALLELPDGATRRVYGEASRQGYDPTISAEDIVVTDERIVDDGAAFRHAFTLLEVHGEESIEAQLTLMDSNGNVPFGYDIESLAPGDTLRPLLPTVQVYEQTKWDWFTWDNAAWGSVEAGLVQAPMVVSSIHYEGDRAIVQLTTRPVSVVEELQNIIEKQLVQGAT